MKHGTAQRLHDLKWPPTSDYVEIADEGGGDVFTMAAYVVMGGERFNLWELLEYAHDVAAEYIETGEF